MILTTKWLGDKPSVVTITNPDNGFVKQIFLWKKGLGTKLFDIRDRETFIKKFVAKCDEIVIIDYKQFVDYFGILDAGKIYDFPSDDGVDLENPGSWLESRKDVLAGKWQLIRAKAAIVYNRLEKSGVRIEHQVVYPKYEMTVYSGRSKVVGAYNIQGMTEEWPIRHVNSSNTLFLHFDWISADMRMGALISGDTDMLESFNLIDPYGVICEALDGVIPRADVKQEFMKAVYSLSGDSEILRVYPVFAQWINDQAAFLDANGYTESILGRRYYTDGTRKGKLRAVNAILQGSVAHAVNNVLWQVEEKCGDILVTEQHDSIIVAVKQELAQEYIKSISDIMYRPLLGLTDKDLTMPLKVAVGKSWRKYKHLKDFR